MEVDKDRVKVTTVKCTMKDTKQKGKKYRYPQYSLTLKKPYVFSKGEEVVVLGVDEVNRVLGIDDPTSIWEAITQLKEDGSKAVELTQKLEEVDTKHAGELKEQEDQWIGKVGDLQKEVDQVGNLKRHTEERLRKEQDRVNELEQALLVYSKKSVFKIFLHRLAGDFPQIEAPEEEKGVE